MWTHWRADVCEKQLVISATVRPGSCPMAWKCGGLILKSGNFHRRISYYDPSLPNPVLFPHISWGQGPWNVRRYWFSNTGLVNREPKSMCSWFQIFACSFLETRASTDNPADWHNWHGISIGAWTDRPVKESAAVATLCWTTREATSSGKTWTGEGWSTVQNWKGTGGSWCNGGHRDTRRWTNSHLHHLPGVIDWAKGTATKWQETLFASFVTSVSNNWEGSTVSTDISCDVEAGGTATEEGGRPAPDSTACTRVEAGDWLVAEFACTLYRGLEGGPLGNSLWGRVLVFALGMLTNLQSERKTF